jgi:hypothetical protein
MPDDILFTGDFDSTEFKKGIDEMVAALGKMQQKEKELNNDLNVTTETLKDNSEGIKKLTAEIAKLDKTNSDYYSKNKQLESRLKALGDYNTKLSTQLQKQQQDYAKVAEQMGKMQKGYDAAVESVKKLEAAAGKPIAPAINSGAITQQIGNIKDKVKEAGSAIVDNLGNGSSLVDNVTGSVQGLAGSFGPLGIAAGAALGFIIKKLYEWVTASTEAEITQRILLESQNEANKVFADAGLQVNKMATEIQLAKEGFLDKDKVLKEYNETIGKTTGLVNSLEEAEAQLIAKGPAFIQLMFLKAKAQGAYNAAVKEAEKASTAQLDAQDNFGVFDQIKAYREGLTFFEKIKQFSPTAAYDPDLVLKQAQVVDQAIDANAKEAEKKAQDRSKSLFGSFEQFQKDAAKFAKDNGLNFFGDTKTEKDEAENSKKRLTAKAKVIENIYEQELQKLKADIAKLDEKGFTDEATITKAVEEDFKKRELAFDKAFKKGQLSSAQLSSLKDNLSNLQTLTLNKQLKDFGEQRKAYLQKIADELEAVQYDESLKRIAGLQNDYERERQLIEAEADKTAAAIKRKREKLIADIKKDAAKNGVTDAEVKVQVDAITNTYGQLLDDLEVLKNQKLQKLSFDTFEKLSEDAKRLLDAGNLGISQGSLINIKEQAALFTAGKISYQEYQKELSKIAKFEAHERFLIEKLFLEAEIRIREQKLLTDKQLTDKQIKQLQDEIARLRKQLIDAEKGDVIASTSNNSDGKNEGLQRLVKYTQALSGLVETVVSFWQKANDAEQRALERSIGLQNRRVDAARRVAERGNAEYLRLEEERLQALQLKQENAARRTLAINAALQASQAITAVVTGIAKGIETGGPIGGIIALTAVLGAIAAGYALVQSLKPQQPSFFVGTEDTGTGGKADGKGGFHAILHPHERVLTKEQNKKLKGLTNEQLVNTVTASRLMHQTKSSIPGLNLAAMDMANNVTATQNVRMAALLEEQNNKLEENNQLQRKTHRLLSSMGINVSMDKNGIAVSVLEATQEIAKAKKS